MPQVPQPQVVQFQTKLATFPSKRARILQALNLLLPTITKAAGYNFTCEYSGFDVKGFRDKAEAETPAVYIVDDVTILTKHAGLTREYRWTIRLFGVVKGKSIMDFELFITDMEQCIYDNNTLFGQVNKVEVENITTDNQLFSELNDSGTHLFELELAVEYTRNARDAR